MASDPKKAQPDLAPLPVVIEEEEKDAQRIMKITLDTLAQKGAEFVVSFMERREMILSRIRKIAIQRTNPQDWTLYKDKEGRVVGILRDSGAVEVRKWLGISIYNHRSLDGEPGKPTIRETLRLGTKDEVVVQEMLCDADAAFTGERVEGIYCSVRSDDEFVGRASASHKERQRPEDLTACLRTMIDTKAVRILSGLRKVPGEELISNGINLDNAYKGHGYGSASERAAKTVAEGDVAQKAKDLGDEILRRCGGEKETARSLLVEITRTEKFKGFDSIARLTKEWQVEQAWKKLRAHEIFGDAPQGE